MITIVLNDQEKKEFAKARTLPSSSSIVEIITLQYLYEEFDAEVFLKYISYSIISFIFFLLSFSSSF